MLAAPVISTLYERIKQAEKTMRTLFKKTEKELSPSPIEPPDLSWKEYVLSLENESPFISKSCSRR
ncbi:MAG: hypothetical protein S4CHLAM123_09370 [Chlamydiales bacterium]|nr:hypothetical protein [Chlamydiales bacterium]